MRGIRYAEAHRPKLISLEYRITRLRG